MWRHWHVWLAFVFFLAVLLAAMGWVSRAVLRLEAERTQAQYQAAVEENVRLALWRMDSSLAPLLAEEGSRPCVAYQSFFASPFGDAPAGPEAAGRMLVPSPLLADPPEHVLVYFQLDAAEGLSSPQVPPENQRELAVPKYTSHASVARAQERLDELATKIDRARLVAMLPEHVPAAPEVVWAPWNDESQQFALRRQRADVLRQGRAATEFYNRVQAVQTTNAAVLAQNEFPSQLSFLSATNVGGVLMTPLWIDGQLLLARRITVEGQELVQGCLLDWPAIKQWLLESVDDLLPDADLLPVEDGDNSDQSRRLAALPLRLVPGDLPLVAPQAPSALGLSLVVAWACVVVAAVCVAGLLWGVMRLSERRAAFVSAVTHELRTPLTTFQMYAEMLAEGMVAEESQRRQYLDTLRREAGRLTHLVENVLSYARLERGRDDHRTEQLSAEELLARAAPRLEDRAQQAGMELVVESAGEASRTTIETNPAAVEQILLNLVDNACKYAAAGADKRIHLSLSLSDRRLELSVRDHGPGLPADLHRRLFRPFCKSAHEAAESGPGVGLGLALSRRMARRLGGRLRFDAGCRSGARFVLSLPVGVQLNGAPPTADEPPSA